MRSPEHRSKANPDDRDWAGIVGEIVGAGTPTDELAERLGVRRTAVYAWRSGEARVPDRYREALLELHEPRKESHAG